MVGEWRETTIGEFAPFAYGKGLPEHARNATGGVPVFGSNGLVGLHDAALTEGPTVVIGRKGTVGAVHYSSVPCWPIDTTFWVTDPDRAVLRFKYYLLKSIGLEYMNADSAVPGLNREAAHARRILVPPLPEQRAIAHILGTLDDKIELNRRISETLEQMARAIFKAWFVDFEPVRAKMNSPSPFGRGARGEGARSEGVRRKETKGEAKKPPLPEHLLHFARQLRKNATDAENLLWRLLRNRQLAGAKFRRQHPVPPYVLDFYCHEQRLAVEIDGGQHNQPDHRRRDARRSEFLAQQGIRVLRFWSDEVLRETEAVLEAIYDALTPGHPAGGTGTGPHPNPLPEGEGVKGWPQHILDLFPDRLVDSELGEIPEGWKVGTLGDLAEVTSGKRPDETFASATSEANVPLWGGNGPMAYVRQPLFIEPILLTGRVGTLGSVFRIPSACWPSDNTLVVLPRKRLYTEYLYIYTSSAR